MSIADMLLAKMAVGIEESLRSLNRAFFNQMCCLTAIARAMYSASVVEVVIDFCFQHFQKMVESLS